MDIKRKITSDNYVIVIDTNVLLRLYDYSPEFSLFALQCLKSVSDYLVIPSTVRIEFLRNYRGCYSRMKDRVDNYSGDAEKHIDKFEDSITKKFDEISNLHFPDVDTLKNKVCENIDRIRADFDNYLLEHSSLKIINSEWVTDDEINKFMNLLIEREQVMDNVTQDQLYSFCEEGEKRYKEEIPPGFKDAKNKDGLRKYSDLVLWKEILHYSSKHKRNIIFVTDDQKPDWWQQSTSDTLFHPKLIEEFAKNTHKKLIACSSFQLYDALSLDYSIPKSDAIELALTKTTDDYANAIFEDVFDAVLNDLVYSGEKYIDDESTYMGASEGIELTDDIKECSLLSAELTDQDGSKVTYLFKYDVTIIGESFDYLGRDDDTKETILSPANVHTFNGTIEVEVIRELEPFADLADDTTFQSASILSGQLKQIDFKSYYSDQNYCPCCGEPITFENDSLAGFCTQCAQNQ